MSSIPASSAQATPAHGPAVRRIGEADVRWALGEGWRDFQEKRGDLIFAGLLYPLIGLVTALVVFNEQLLPLFFPLVAGLSLLGPVVSAGFYELARRREEGLDSSWWHFLDPVRGRSREGLGFLTLGLAGLFVGWLIVAWLIYQATLGRLGPMPLETFLPALFGTPEGWTMIVLGNLAGFVFAVVTLAVTIVSVPLVVDRPVDAGTAVLTSIRAVRANPGPVAWWGLRVAALLVLGSIPAFIGLALVLPWLGYATWHLYTRMVERPA